jgi:hypothetical protein
VVGSPISMLCGKFDGFSDDVVCLYFFIPHLLEFSREIAALFGCLVCECWNGWYNTSIFYYFLYPLYHLVHFFTDLLPLIL